LTHPSPDFNFVAAPCTEKSLRLKSSTPLAGHLRFAAFLKQEGIEIQLENLWISNREQLWRTFPKMLLAGIH